MQGFAHGSRRACHRVWSTFFRHGWNLVGDHSLFSACLGQYCYYGAYVDDANPVLYGDYRFEYCFFMGNSFAGIGVSPNALLNGLFIKPYWGGEAYHIVGEAGPGVDYDQPFGGSPATPIIQGSAFHLGQWEWAGNCSIADLNAERTRPLINVSFHGGYWSWDTGRAIAGRGQDYYFDYGASEGVTFYDVNNGSFEVTEGQLGFMRTNAVGCFGGGLKFQGAMRTVLGKYSTAGLPFIAEAFGRLSAGQWRKILIEDEGWTGRVGMVGGTAAVPDGTVLEAGGEFQGVRPSTGGSNPLVGIVVCGVPAVDAASDRLVVYAVGSDLRARWGAGANTAGQWVKSTASGTLQPAAGKADGQVVGWAWHENGGGMNSPTIQTTFAV